MLVGRFVLVFWACFVAVAGLVFGLPAFPGAVGFGADTVAGSGRHLSSPSTSVFKVTNLNDAGSGSLRECVEASGPRVCVFEVAGTIWLNSPLQIRNPYLTIAGQTAPSPGITVAGSMIELIKVHDVLIQHIRFRMGDKIPKGKEWDTLHVTQNSYNIVLDHLSISWSIDENFNVGYGSRDVTLSNSIVSEGLDCAGVHPENCHSKGIMLIHTSRNVAFIRNLLAHNKDRNILWSSGDSPPDPTAVMANNLIYNWKSGRATRLNADGKSPQAAIVGNVYLRGPDTSSSSPAIDIIVSTRPSVYVDDIIVDNERPSDAWSAVKLIGSGPDPKVPAPPLWPSGFSAMPSSEVYDYVISNAGARPGDRDPVDKRVMNEVVSRTGRVIDSQEEVGGWPYAAGEVLSRRSLSIPPNPHGDDDGDGYTNLEEWLFSFYESVGDFVSGGGGGGCYPQCTGDLCGQSDGCGGFCPSADLNTCGKCGNGPCDFCTDSDSDGFNVSGGSCGAKDCDDANDLINPGAAEICDNSADDDCDGLSDCEDPDCSGDASCGSSSGGLSPFGIVTVDPDMVLNGAGRNIDSLAFWEAPDPADTLLFVTAKANDLVEVWKFPFEGNELSPLRFDSSVNGVVVDQDSDLLLVTETGARKVDVFSLPDLTFVRDFGSDVIKSGENNLDILDRSSGDLIYVSSDYEVFIFRENGEFVSSFKPPVVSIETVLADDFYEIIYVPEEQGASGNEGVYAYKPDGSPYFRGGSSSFGDGPFESDEEGILLYSCPSDGLSDDGSGFILISDQRGSQTDFEVFDRVSWEHLGTIRLTGVSNTDGVASTQKALPGFPMGLFAAVDDDTSVALVGWDKVLSAAGISCSSESAGCVEGEKESCVVSGLSGVCASGERVCSGGVWGNCQQVVFASSEDCGNGLDDDCDSFVDCDDSDCSTDASCSAVSGPGDLDGDGVVSFSDLILVALNYGKKSGFDPRADANGDGEVSFPDLILVALNYGKEY